MKSMLFIYFLSVILLAVFTTAFGVMPTTPMDWYCGFVFSSLFWMGMLAPMIPNKTNKR